MQSKCSIDGCDRSISNKSTGLCHMHHLRFIRTGKTESGKVDKTKKCEVDGCNRYAQTKQYGNVCLMHHKRFHRYGTWELPIKQHQKKCKFCDKKIGGGGAYGMCASHYRSFKLYGDPLTVEKRKNESEISVKSTGYYGRKNKKERHQTVMEHKIGRPLKNGEIVHHINLSKLDNRPENLHLCKGCSEHSLIHRQLERVGAELYRRGIIGFKDGEYYIM